MSESKTPRTDAEELFDERYDTINIVLVRRDFARQLERELQAANARVEELEGYLTFYSTGQKSLEKDLRTQLSEAKAEIERLRFELAELGALEMSHEGACVRLQNELAEAKAKLESVKKSAKIGMAAAQRIGSVSLAEAQRIQKTLKPETLESEREMNRILTEELEEAKAEIEHLRSLIP